MTRRQLLKKQKMIRNWKRSEGPIQGYQKRSLKTNNILAADRGFSEFFVAENLYLKILLVLAGLYAAIFLRWYYFISIFLLTIVWLLPGWRIIREYTRILLRLLPFIISYLILGILFNIPLSTQLIFIGRIALLLLFSVFLIKTISTERLLNETYRLRQRGLLKKLFSFSMATGLFVELFLKEIRETRSKIKRIDDVVKIIINSFGNVYEKTDTIEELVLQMTSRPKCTYPDRESIYSWPNVYLIFLLALYTLILAL